MLIPELQDKMNKINMNLTIIFIEPVREFNNQKVTTALVDDEEGNIGRLALWRKDTEAFKVGDKVKLVNGFAQIRKIDDNGTMKMCVSAGKNGWIEKEEN